MKELFLQPLSLLSAVSLLLIIAWFALELLKKYLKVQVWLFAVSHLLLYIDAFKFHGKSFYLVSSIILLLTLCVFLIKGFREGFKINIGSMIYLIFTSLLATVFFVYFSLWCVSSAL